MSHFDFLVPLLGSDCANAEAATAFMGLEDVLELSIPEAFVATVGDVDLEFFFIKATSTRCLFHISSNLQDEV
jgi:hypothetical protein